MDANGGKEIRVGFKSAQEIARLPEMEPALNESAGNRLQETEGARRGHAPLSSEN
jgi:hypothetical protein